MSAKFPRRKFIITSAVTTGVVVGGTLLSRQSKNATSSESSNTAQSVQPENPTTPSASKSIEISDSTIPQRELGKTGVNVPILGLGGAGKTPISWNNKEKEAIALIESALQLGIRYFDTADSYGPSEERLGKVLQPFRSDLFLASKSGKRDRDGFWRDLEQSLTRLKTDYLDLYQLHHVSFQEDLDTIFGPNGAAKALEEAKEQKLIRFTGITGHHEPDIIAQGLERYPFDTTLITINAADKHHPRPFITGVLPIAKAKNVGVIAMKVPAYGRLFQPGILSGMEEAFGYVLSQPGVHTAIIAAENPEQLASNIAVAKQFQPLPEDQLATIESKTANAWEETTFFRAWT